MNMSPWMRSLFCRVGLHEPPVQIARAGIVLGMSIVKEPCIYCGRPINTMQIVTADATNPYTLVQSRSAAASRPNSELPRSLP